MKLLDYQCVNRSDFKPGFGPVETYAFYDSGSSGCFITDGMCDKLGATGVLTQLQLRTMHGSTCTESHVIKDLVVSAIDGTNPLTLPKAYTQEIPITRDQIPTPEMIQRWQHLRHLTHQIPKYRSDLDIGILIGSNCPKALEPLEVTPAKGSGPFATRLRHGLTIYGPLKVSGSGSEIAANRILVREIDTYKEDMSPSSMISALEQDFQGHETETFPGEKALSQEDRKFLEIGMEFDNGHYTLPLPFHDEDVVMPDSKSLVLKRANLQKRGTINDSVSRRLRGVHG